MVADKEALPRPVPRIEFAPEPLPETAKRLPAPVNADAEFTPNRAPRSRSKVSLTMTMRASISTCLTGTSKVCTKRRMSASLSEVSCTNRVLVRSSTDRLPRGDSMESLALLVLISFARSETLA